MSLPLSKSKSTATRSTSSVDGPVGSVVSAENVTPELEELWDLAVRSSWWITITRPSAFPATNERLSRAGSGASVAAGRISVTGTSWGKFTARGRGARLPSAGAPGKPEGRRRSLRRASVAEPLPESAFG